MPESVRPGSVMLLLFLLFNSLLLTAQTFAASLYEVEPNNTPTDAIPISGEITILGTMPGRDQDGFLWTVSDNDARKRWTLELHGIPGALTIAEVVRLDYADNGGDVSGKTRLMKMGSRDGLLPAIASDLIFEPGEYLIGIAHAGSSKNTGSAPFRPPSAGLSFGASGTTESTSDVSNGDSIESDIKSESATDSMADPDAYRFIIREGARLDVRAETDSSAGREQAQPMRPGREAAAFVTRESGWYAFTFGDKDIDQRWDIAMQVPVGRTVDAKLYDDAGEVLADTRSDARGKFAFPDLAPAAQTYHVELSSKERDFIRAVASESVGQRVSGAEAEPNGKWEMANRVDLAEPLSGRIAEKNDTDYFRFSAGDALLDRLAVLRIESATPGENVEFCLLDANKVRTQCRRSKTPVELPDLLLGNTAWGMSVSRAADGMEYQISLSAQGPVVPAREVEPNDTMQYASSVPAKNRIKGRISGDDTDYFRFMVSTEPQLWRFQVIGEGLAEVTYQNVSGRQTATVKPAQGQKRIRLENLFLMPGQHLLKIHGKTNTDYTVIARALGAPDLNSEREPNDDTSRMQLLSINQTRTGLIADADDRDYYRFFLANYDHVRLTLQPPPDGEISAQLYWYGTSLGNGRSGQPGEPITLTGVFPPGDYHVQLSAKTASDAEYSLSLERLPRFSCATDCEPNGMADLHFAPPIPSDGMLQGQGGSWGDRDPYQLPLLSEPSKLVIRSDNYVRLAIGINRYEGKPLTYDKGTGIFQTTVPAGGPYQLIVEPRGEDYQLKLAFPNGPVLQPAQPLDAKLGLTLESTIVSAYRTYGQRLSGQIEIHNPGRADIEVNLEAVTSDYRWHVIPAEDHVKIAPGATARIPLALDVPPDAWADRPVRISVRAYRNDGGQVETWQEIAVDRDVAAAHPDFGWRIPESLRGGFNVAWLPFGAQWTEDQPKGSNYQLLRDGLVFDNMRTQCCSSGWQDGNRPSLTLQLPADQAVPLAGIAINHFGTPGVMSDLRQGAVLVSDDGVTFTEVLEFEALPVETEQYFPLPEPVPARYVRMRIDSNFNMRPGTNGISLGEWKVITSPDVDLSNGAGFNIADPAFGGHIVSDWPAKFYPPKGVVDLEDKGYSVRLKPGDNQDYIIGFHHNRAAKIERIDWVYDPEGRAENRFKQVLIAGSTDSAVGPWIPIGEIDPTTADTVSFELETPVWARFVKLTGVPVRSSGVSEAPATIRIWEQPSGSEYRSVLTEWGHASRRAFYEVEQGLKPEPVLAAVDNDTRDSAALLEPGMLAAGQVALAKQEHWYRLKIPEGDNTLTLTLSGDPTVRTEVTLETSTGEQIPLRKNIPLTTPGQHVFDAVVEPMDELYLHILEPPRNVVFTWDTSASVVNYLPTIYNSLSAFASQVVPGQEAVNLVPFARSPLLRDWYGEPYMLQTILNDYPRGTSSSSAELTIQKAAQILGPLAGSKAIVVITDGITVHHGPMWREMRAVQPRIFGIGIGGSDGWNIDVFEDWASVNGGHYTHLNYRGEMEVAFDRAATMMRRPAEYNLLVESAFREAPGPGRLLVLSGKQNTTTVAAVELILDASGSMLQRLEGKRRIVIAKEVLTEAVTQHIPPGTNVALRVFGHKEPDACRTDLEMPLAPLNPAAAVSKIAEIQAMNLARTPIADSLAAVVADLQGTSGRAAIILVTDGEETCDGDPAKVIESLQAKGMDVSLNIVGFAIDDPELAEQFAGWAEQGNGRYFSASNQEGLSGAIEEALQVPYKVFDESGDQVAAGLVDGAPVELKQGFYRIVVGNSEASVFENIGLRGNHETILRLEN